MFSTAEENTDCLGGNGLPTGQIQYMYRKASVSCDGKVLGTENHDESIWLAEAGWRQVGCGDPDYDAFAGRNATASTCDPKCIPEKPKMCGPLENAQTTQSNKVGDPIDLTTGFLDLSVTDADLGRGLAFTRYYSTGYLDKTGKPDLTSMGMSWRHSFDWTLARYSGNGSVEIIAVVTPLGLPEVFGTFSGESEWSAPGRTRGAIEGNFVGPVTYIATDGTEVDFDATDELDEIRPVGQPTITVTQAGDDVTYTNGTDTIVVSHYATLHVNAGQVEEVDANGVVTEYRYDSSDYLTEVDVPDVDAPGLPGQLIEYDYAYGNSTGSGLTLTQADRMARGVGQSMGGWTYWANSVRVKTADEPGLDQDLHFTYDFAGDDAGTTEIRESTATGPLLATLDVEDGMIFDVTGDGGPGFEPPWSAATVETGSFGGVTANSPRWETRTDPEGNVTAYEDYDVRNRPGRIIEAQGDVDDERKTEYLWHPRLDSPTETERTSTTTGVFGDVRTVFDYDTDGDSSYNQNPTDLIRRRIELGYTIDASGASDDFEIETSFTYNAAGQVISVTGPGPDNLTEHTYDTSGNRTSTKRYIDGATFLETKFGDVGGFDRGNPLDVTDPNERVTNFTYDAAGRVETVVPPFGGTGDPTITFTYDVDGRIERIDFPASYSLDFGYSADGKGDLRFIADSTGDAIVYEYVKGRRTRASLYRGFSTLATPGTLLGDASFTYGVVGRLEKALNPLFGGTVFTEFDHDLNGNTDSVTDENGKQDTLMYDALDRLEEVVQVRTATYTTGFAYDEASNVKQVTDAASKATDYKTDDLGRLVEVDSPDTGITRFLYDAAGNLETKIEDAGGAAQRSTTYTYDGLDRLLTIVLPNDPDWTFTYDTDAAKNQKGRLAKADNTVVTTELEYTDRGQLASEATVYDSWRYTVAYSYDAAGNIDTITTPAGTVIDYTYTGSRVSQVDATYGTQTESITGIDWLPFGPLESATLPGGATLERTYNLRYQLEELLVEDSLGADLVHRSYTYDHTVGSSEPDDPGPNLDRVVDSLDATESRFYFYDDLDRLSRATDLSATDLFTYGYDAAGNRLTKTNAAGTTSYSYETSTDRLASATGAEAAFYAHDAYGNRIYEGATAYTGTPNRVYNDQNRLVSVIPALGDPHESVYDAFGRRVDGHGMIFAYDQAGRILEASLRDGSSGFFGDLVWVEGELLGRVEDNVAVGTSAWVPPIVRPWIPRADRMWLVAVGAGGTLLFLSVALRTRSPRWGTAGAALALVLVVGVACVPTGVAFFWVVTDHLGTPIAMTDTPTSGEAKVIWKASYEPFGKAIEDLNPDGDGKFVRMPVRFPGQWSDFNTGLHYNFFRDYDPKTGRYLEADPIGQFGSLLVADVAPMSGAMLGRGFSARATGPFEIMRGHLFQYATQNPVNRVDPLGLWTISVGITGSAAVGVGGGGGTFFNFGWDPSRGLSGFSVSLTGTAAVAAAAAAEASLGATFALTNACDVSGLLGGSNEVTVGGVGPTGFGNIFDEDGEFIGGFFSYGFDSKGIALGSVTDTTTSAIIQYNNGRTTVGDTGAGALWSSD